MHTTLWEWPGSTRNKSRIREHQPLSDLIGSHWSWRKGQQITQVLCRGQSKAKIADPFSRRDCSIAQSLGWKILPAPTEEIIPTLQKAVGHAISPHQQGFLHYSAIQQFHKHLYQFPLTFLRILFLVDYDVYWFWRSRPKKMVVDQTDQFFINRIVLLVLRPDTSQSLEPVKIRRIAAAHWVIARFLYDSSAYYTFILEEDLSGLCEEMAGMQLWANYAIWWVWSN